MIETTVDGRYQIVARIAAGGMGEVYRAHDPVLDREVALKVLHHSLADDPGFIDRFRREARAAGLLSHPNIVAVHDWGETADTYFMVMEFVRGSNVRALLMKEGPLAPAHAAEITSGVLAALEHAHEHGIVHRDIKPENVMVTPKGVVKVADFGLARAFADSRISQAPGTVTGTVQYLAPEQIEGQPADPRTDLYATGIVLYELLTGKVPFTGETSVAIAYRHLRERVAPPSRSNPMVPRSLDRVVLAATDRDRDRRTADARTMRAELTRAAAELPPASPLAEVASSVTQADETPADRLSTVTIPRTISPKQRRRQRVRRVWTILSLLVVLAVAGWAVWTYLIPHPTRVPDVEGDRLASAQREARQAGLELVVAREAFSSDVPAGRVISQNPDPRSEAEEGDRLTVVLSRGPELVPVPSVEGIPLEEARRRLDRSRLEVVVSRQYHDTIPENQVISQSPPAESPLEVGQSVELVVSRGKEPVQVPRVVGLSESAAGSTLDGAQLGVRITEDFSASVPEGQVISQSPRAFTTVPADSVVTIVVSLGPREFPMPNVIGMTEAEATARLQGLGLQVQTSQVPGSTGHQVVGQDPDPGITVRQGQSVRIYLANPA
jgi:eukaryotic-like serine/threonine-protein kinase